MDLVDLRHFRSGNAHSGTDGAAIALSPDQLKDDAVVRVPGFIEEYRRRGVNIEDHCIQLPIVIYVTNGSSPAGIKSSVIKPNLVGYVLKCEISVVSKELNGLGKLIIPWQRVEQRREVAIAYEYVGPPVVVEISKSSAPFHRSGRGYRYTGFAGDVDEILALIQIEAG